LPVGIEALQAGLMDILGGGLKRTRRKIK